MIKNPKTKLKRIESPKLKHYICYYYMINDRGDRMDNFKERGDFANRDEAESEFRRRYPDEKRYEIGFVQECKD